MITEFWNANLNPITMYTKERIFNNDAISKKIKQNYLTDDLLVGYITANEIMKDLKIGAVKLKRMFEQIGVQGKYNRSVTYYPAKYIQTLRNALAEQKTIPKVDKSGFISTQELMTIFDFTTDKAFNIILKEKLTKTRFGGNINYYNRATAIETFSLYKK